jgi:hypothetical protein
MDIDSVSDHSELSTSAAIIVKASISGEVAVPENAADDSDEESESEEIFNEQELKEEEARLWRNLNLDNNEDFGPNELALEAFYFKQMARAAMH